MITTSHGIRFLHGSHRPRCVASVDKQFDYYTLQMMAAGTISLSYDDELHRLEGAWCWPAWPGPTTRFHEWPRGQPWDHRYIAFDGPGVAAWEAEGLMPKTPLALTDDAQRDKLAMLWDELLTQRLSVRSLCHLRAVNLLEQILIELAELEQEQRRVPESWLTSVLKSLQNVQSHHDYAQMAQSHGMSLTSLRRKFRQLTGVSLHRFQIDTKVALACRKLGDSDEPIKSIADQLGYLDIHYFTRQFTQITGTSPGRYRRSRQDREPR